VTTAQEISNFESNLISTPQSVQLQNIAIRKHCQKGGASKIKSTGNSRKRAVVGKTLASSRAWHRGLGFLHHEGTKTQSELSEKMIIRLHVFVPWW
jgi:hypothetical protein